MIVVGANDTMTLEDVDNARSLLKHSSVLVCQLEVPVRVSLAALRGYPGISILNASPPPLENNLEIYTLPNILCLNEHEAGSMTKRGVPNME